MAVHVKRDEIDSLLIKANKSQAWLAGKLKITKSHLNNILAGRLAASPDIRERLMDKLSVDDWDSIFKITD